MEEQDHDGSHSKVIAKTFYGDKMTSHLDTDYAFWSQIFKLREEGTKRALDQIHKAEVIDIKSKMAPFNSYKIHNKWMHEYHWTDRACIYESIVDLNSEDKFGNYKALNQVSI